MASEIFWEKKKKNKKKFKKKKKKKGNQIHKPTNKSKMAILGQKLNVA
jgi:hypothetical protein